MSKQSGGFDFAQARKLVEKEEEGVTFDVRGPDGSVLEYKGKPVTMTVCGSYSPTYQALDDDFNRTWLAKELEDVPERERRARLEEAWLRRQAAHDLAVRAKCIRSWYGFLDGGKEVELTPEMAEQAMQTPWLAPQIRSAQERHEGFFTEASDG